MKLDVFFLIFRKHLTKFGMMVSYLNWHKMTFWKFHTLLHDFLVNRKQRVLLNELVSSWANIKAGVPQASILGQKLFLIYTNGLPKGLSSNAKLFADNTLFSVIHYSSATRNELNDNSAYQWKMSSYPDPNK